MLSLFCHKFESELWVKDKSSCTENGNGNSNDNDENKDRDNKGNSSVSTSRVREKLLFKAPSLQSLDPKLRWRYECEIKLPGKKFLYSMNLRKSGGTR